MEKESLSPDEPIEVIAPAPPAPLEPDSPALATALDDSFFETRRFREGGWDGPGKALFIGTLAETGVVTFACRACLMSAKSAYALRHRDPLFGKAWEAALDMARHRLADELLSRALKGSAEQLMRDGCIVGERHHYDNKLAFAILRRLDRQAEVGATFRTPPAWEIPLPAPAVSGQWHKLLDALGEDRASDAAALLVPAQHEQGNTQGNNPPIEGVEGDEVEEPYVEKRVWQEFRSGDWRTNFPPPPDFAGESRSSWEKHDYSRALTAAELDAFNNDGSDNVIVTLEQDEADRDAFFAALAAPMPPPSADAAASPTVERQDISAASPPPGVEPSGAGAGTRPENPASPAGRPATAPAKPPKSEPPPKPDRLPDGASNQGEFP